MILYNKTKYDSYLIQFEKKNIRKKYNANPKSLYTLKNVWFW